MVALAVIVVALLASAGCAGPGTPPTTARSVPGSAAPASGALVVEQGLLSVLPASVGGLPMTPVADTAASMAADPGLGTSASGVAVGVVVASEASAGDDLAIATVIRLRPGMYSEGFFEGWRRAYDDAACAPAGGVASRADEIVAMRTVLTATCVEGARTYHAHLGGDIIVSVTAVGNGGFGELVMAGLHE